jgi:hypothetical protein
MVNTIPPPIDQGVDGGKEGVNHSELVGDFRTAKNDGVWPLWRARQSAQNPHFFFHQQSRAARQESREFVDTGLFAVNNAKPVNHNGV